MIGTWCFIFSFSTYKHYKVIDEIPLFLKMRDIFEAFLKDICWIETNFVIMNQKLGQKREKLL